MANWMLTKRASFLLKLYFGVRLDFVFFLSARVCLGMSSICDGFYQMGRASVGGRESCHFIGSVLMLNGHSYCPKTETPNGSLMSRLL